MNTKQHIPTISSLEYQLEDGGIESLVSGCGVTTLRFCGGISKEVEALRQEILNEKRSGMVSSPTVGDVYQDFHQKVSFDNEELLNTLAQKISSIVQKTIYHAGGLRPHVPLVFDSVIIQHYSYSTSNHLYAIPPHYDHKGFVELVVVLLLEGESLFHTAKDKDCTAEKEIKANEMDLIVMRGFEFQGKDERPVHYVKKIKSQTGRTSLSFRIYSKNEEHLNTIRKAFSMT